MFCPYCGNQIPDDSVFCEMCGAQIEAPAAAAPVQMPMTPGTAAFASADTMIAAAQIAMTRNLSQEWSYWDDPGFYDYGAQKLLRFCEKEDKRLVGEPVNYLISPDGAIGRVYTDEGETILEWNFYTRGSAPGTLPTSPDGLM